MPRNAKRNPGTMPATSPGQAYGVAGDQKAAMQQMPLPEAPLQTPVNPSTPPSPLPAVQAEAALSPEDAALIMDPPPEGGALAQPTAYPDEPLTAGMSIGDGPGPDSIPVLAARSAKPGPVAATLAAMAAANGGDPVLQMLASRAADRRT